MNRPQAHNVSIYIIYLYIVLKNAITQTAQIACTAVVDILTQVHIYRLIKYLKV